MPATGLQKGTGGGKVLPALCNVFGTVLLLAVIALCLPMVVPGLLGYQTFNVVSGSMEPTIPIGSAIYVEPIDPAYLEKDDIIAFYDGEDVIAHRVSINRATAEELVTKGDANDVEDFDPIPYASVVGRVVLSVPTMGAYMSVCASTVGKVYLLLTAACGLMLNILASRMRAVRRAREQQLAQQAAALGVPGVAAGAGVGSDSDSGSGAGKSTRTRRIGWKPVAAVLLAVVFLGSAGVVGATMYQYFVSDAIYQDASDRYTSEGTVAPISVDFEALQAKNPDIVGWIYCEGTPIDYPVLQGKDNDQYLHTDYTGAYNIDGSIFVDADNTPGFVDSNTIIYGHHMASGAMFAGLEKWADQAYYEEHPVIWLLTPEKDYQIVLFSGHHVDSHSSMYDIIKNPGPEMNTFLSEALEKSDFKGSSGVQLNPRGRYVMLSTCAYLFDGDRYVLHGLLVTATGKK